MAESKVQKVARGKAAKKDQSAGTCACGEPRIWASLYRSRMVKYCEKCGTWEEKA